MEQFKKWMSGAEGKSSREILGSAHQRVDARRVECVSRSWLHGLAVGPVTFAVIYFCQGFFTRRFSKKISRGMLLLNSGAFGLAAAYLVLNQQLLSCEKSWQQQIQHQKRLRDNPNAR